MAGIVKRKVRQTWREAVSARLADLGPGAAAAGLAEYDAAVAGGVAEVEAAYRALAARDLLWPVDAPGFKAVRPAGSEAGPPRSALRAD